MFCADPLVTRRVERYQLSKCTLHGQVVFGADDDPNFAPAA